MTHLTGFCVNLLTHQGWQLTEHGMRRLRRELMAEYGPAPVSVFTVEAFGIFHITEVMEVLGAAPAASLRKRSLPPRGRDQPLS